MNKQAKAGLIAKGSGQAATRPVLSVVTPAYNEAANLPLLYERLSNVVSTVGNWEWIVVDDHSSDETFAIIASIASQDSRVRAIRLARNFGSHIATTCGLHHVRGECAIVMASDLQDPPEIVPALLAKWHAGAQVVWAVRARREGETLITLALSRLYYLILRRLVGFKEMPERGADFLLIDVRVVDAFRQFNESNVSVLSLIAWMGFRQATVTYHKQARLHGRSGWSFEKKLKLAIDSFTSFSYLPIRVFWYLGSITAIVGFGYGGVVLANVSAGEPPSAWASLMGVILIMGGIQMLMMGILGEYLWRALDEGRRRPRYLIEATTSPQSNPNISHG